MGPGPQHNCGAATALTLPTIAAMWQSFTERADREGWPAARLLATLTELEFAERDQRRIQRHLLEARLPPGKTLDSFDRGAATQRSPAPEHSWRD
jgi:DNA replication protein DnaC